MKTGLAFCEIQYTSRAQGIDAETPTRVVQGESPGYSLPWGWVCLGVTVTQRQRTHEKAQTKGDNPIPGRISLDDELERFIS